MSDYADIPLRAIETIATLRQKLEEAERELAKEQEAHRLTRVAEFAKISYRDKRHAQMETRITALEAENARLRADKDRLDFLDECNRRLNAYCGTRYSWELILNHNVNRLMFNHMAVDLNDSKAHGWNSCREAIDREILRTAARRLARAALASGGEQ